jgi:hypothetical protein
MRTPRQHRIDRAVARVLADVGEYLLSEETLLDEAALRIAAPRASVAEIQESIRSHDSAGRLTGVAGATGPKWKLNDAGRAWWAENQ